MRRIPGTPPNPPRRRGELSKGRAINNWEYLVRTALRSGDLRGSSGPERADELGGVVPPSLGQESNINVILQAAEEIQPDDPQVARILCEYAYSMAHNLDPQSEGRGVLQFKTGLMSVIRQKQSKREGERIDRSHDIQRIQEFYEFYRNKHQIDELERRQKEHSNFEEDPGELERRTQRMKKVYQTSRVLNDVLNALTRDATPEEREKLIHKELKDRMETDALKTLDFKAYNILPLETPGVADAIMLFEEVKAASASLEHTNDLPGFPEDYRRPEQRPVDIFDLLEYIFGFQEGNVSNQREHLVLLLSNSQSMLGLPTDSLKLDETAINRCFERLLENYIKWCEYLRFVSMTSRAQAGQQKLLLMAMYLLIWGEAANLRFLPECLCYIFHKMVEELFDILLVRDVQRSKTYKTYEKDGKQYSFLDQVVTPIYQTILANFIGATDRAQVQSLLVVAARDLSIRLKLLVIVDELESKNNKGGKASHAAWRNYDDFNEFFWSPRCDVLGWPWRSDAGFFMKPRKKGVTPDDGKVAPIEIGRKKEKRVGKMTFVEHRTGFHVYHSFHRLWIFFTVMAQAMMVVAFCNEKLNMRTFKKALSVGPTYLIMKSVQSLFDILFIYGAYASTQGWTYTRIIVRLLYYGGLAAGITFLYVKMIQEDSRGPGTTWYHLFLIVLGSYAGAQLLATALLRIPLFRRQADKCSNWGIMRFIFWIHQVILQWILLNVHSNFWLKMDRYFVGRGLYERNRDYIGYTAFWVFVLACKFAFSYHFQIKALVSPTKTIVNLPKDILQYKWHDFVSAHHHNALTIASIWAPVLMIYYLDTQVWYTIVSALVGGLSGARARLGEIRTLSMIRKRFSTFPAEMARILVPSRNLTQQMNRSQSAVSSQAGWSKEKVDAIKFAPLWNEIIVSLREEDFITNREKELLLMPSNHGPSRMVQWPLFLLANKVYMAVEMAQDNKSTNQIQLWERIEKDEYMAYAVAEAYNALEIVLKALVNDEAKTWVRSVFGDVEGGIQESMLVGHFHLRKVNLVLTRITALSAILVHDEDENRKRGAVKAMQDLYETVMHDFLSVELREKFEGWTLLSQAKNDGRLFANLNWPNSIEEKEAVKRLNLLLTIKESAANIPRNLEARRRLQFFTNSLFMHMPVAPPVRKMLSFSVFTPYYEEDVMYSKDQLLSENEDGISIIFYLQKIFPDEWRMFLERVGLTENEMDRQLHNEELDMIELRLWASFRGQTLARTVRGMMYYKKALILASLLEGPGTGDLEEGLESFAGAAESNPGFRKSRALAELKFTYVVTCQIYGVQKQKKDVRASDISYLMKKYESLRIAYIDVVESLREEKNTTTYFSKLIKADADGNDQEIYSIKLPGEFRIGEGKPENQNHAIIFTRGDAVQTIDMNQDNYFEEAFKMRNLLEEFKATNCLRRPTILGIREHVFTGSVSSLAWFMSQQETSFVTLGQRVLARPLKVRMHYGHPDVFDRIFHITRGGISKASKTINISEDIFAGFNSTLRQGNITHHEYIQVGKGRDVGLNQIALFEAKVSSGNGEQILSRDVFRLGQLFDFFRMLSFFYTSVGYYITTLMTTLVIYLFLYGKCYLALSGLDHQLQTVADVSGNAALSSALNTQFLLQIGVFTAIPMIMNFILEQGVLKAAVSFVTMQLQLCSVFFTFSLGTKTHYFGRTILHGGAKYRATGRGFVVRHISFAENYRLYSRSHFTKALEIAMLLIVYLSYGQDNSGVAYILLSFSSWFLAISWLFAPYIFNPSGFEWQKTVEDFDDWTNWLFYKGGISVKGAESWESWWEEEQEHIRHLRGKFWEIILSLRFFFFQYGVVYSLHVSGSSTSLAVNERLRGTRGEDIWSSSSAFPFHPDVTARGIAEAKLSKKICRIHHRDTIGHDVRQVYGYSWIAFAGLIILFKIFSFTNQSSVNFQLILRLFQGLLFMGLVAGVVVAIVFTTLTVGDCFAMLLAFIPTGWGLLSIALALRGILEPLHLWGLVQSGFRLYDAIMGAIIFTPIAFLSWFPFVSTFQTRLVFNQAFSRGLEISIILAGNRPNVM